MNAAPGVIALLTALVAAVPLPRAIDVPRSEARFSVAHIWVDHVSGTIPIVSGTVTLPPGSLIPTSATAVLDATRISTGEPDRDKSLESSDFFDAGRFPHWTFTSTAIVAKDSRSFEMDGDLTMHGVTQREVLNVTASGTPDNPRYRATGQVDRHAFGMSVTRLDPTIGGMVDVTLEVTLK